MQTLELRAAQTLFLTERHREVHGQAVDGDVAAQDHEQLERAWQRGDGVRTRLNTRQMTGAAADVEKHRFAGDDIRGDAAALGRCQQRHEIGQPSDVAAVVVHCGRRVECKA